MLLDGKSRNLDPVGFEEGRGMEESDDRSRDNDNSGAPDDEKNDNDANPPLRPLSRK
jgi:hypothetical protein